MAAGKAKVGKYTITSMIAKGGMGKIYKAWHPTLNRDIILKRLTLVGNRTITERFKREAQLMLDFREDRIVQVYDHFKEGASYYIVMEYIDGISLGDLIDKHRYLPNDIAVMIFYEICGALKYAHDKGVIHRDIKPENILISKDGSVKLTDFGIATSKDCQDECLTKNMTLGTPAYMSPEQITDTSSVDKRADIYSMGVLLYKMVTGKCPYPGNMSPQTINLITKGKYKPPRKVNPRVSPFLQGIIQKAMHRSPGRRYPDLGDLIFKLDGHLKKYKNGAAKKEILRDFIYRNTSGKTQRIKRKNIIIPGNRIKKRILTAAVSFLFIAGMTAYILSSGYHHEFYKSDRYGAWRIDLVVDMKGGDAVRYIHCEIQKRTRGKYTPVNKTVTLKLSRSGSGKNRHVFSSGRLYAMTGHYRTLISVNNRLHHRDFFLMPRTVQRRNSFSDSLQVISVRHRPETALPFSATFRIYDTITRENITRETDIYIYHQGHWIKWPELKRDSTSRGLMSGRKYAFMVKHRRYLTRILRVPVELHQARADISVDLNPVPGILMIKSNTPGIRFLINNTAHCIAGGKQSRVVDLKPLSMRYQRYILAPGNYFLTASMGDKKNITEITIAPGNYRRVAVLYHSSKKTFTYRIF